MLPIGTKVLGMKFLKGLLTANTKVTCDVQRSISKRSEVDLELSSILLARKYIYVPFHEKEEAKALGARWDKSAKRWYIPEGREVKRFQRWLDPHTLHEVSISPPLYIISTTCHCWKCFSPTKVSTLASFGFCGVIIKSVTW